MRAKIFLNSCLGTRLGKAVSNYIEKLSQWGCFFIYFDDKFDDNNNFFQRNTETRNYLKKLSDWEIYRQNISL